MTTRKYSSISQQTTLSSALNASATTMVVGSASALLSGVTLANTSPLETFTVVIDPDTAFEEIVDVVYPSSTGSTTLTIVRGIDSSTPISHSAGAAVRHMGIGRDFRETNSHIENVTSAHGLTIANVVSTTDTSKVSGGMIVDGAVGTAKIDNAAVTEAKLGTSAVTTTKIADSNVTTAKVADLAVTTAKLADSSVTSAKIVDGTIATGDIADGAITSAKIADLTIATGDIADSAITSAKIADGTIVNADINAAAAIDKTKISGVAVTQGDIGTVTSTMIADGTIVNADINSSAQIAYGKLNLTNSVTNADINAAAGIALSKLATDPLARANHTGTQTASTISDFDTQVRTSKLNQMSAPAADVSMATYKVTNLGTPVASTDASTKGYVDTSISNLINGAPSTLDTLSEIATALNNTANFSDTVVLKTGSTMSGALNMGTNKVTNMGTPTVSTDAATKGYVDTVTVAPSNLTGPITSVGNATSIASQTGTGTKFVVDTSPTIVTPTLSGNTTAGTINNTTIPSSKTLVATDSTTYVVPSQTGNSGKYLTTDGTTSSWGTVQALPTQTGNSGKYLTTDGSAASWATVAGALAQPTEPASPIDGQVWVDTDGSTPAAVVTRWSKTGLAAGTTALNGNDDSSIPLYYSAGYEQLFLNGALLSRGNDYTATTGTSITLTNPLVSGDIVEVICPLQIATTDTYTQSAVNSAFVANTTASFAGKNAVINGGMDIAQRGTTFTNPSSGSAYSLDRWQMSVPTTNSSVTRQSTNDTTNLPHIQYCARVQRSATSVSTADFALVQNLETVNSIPFAGKTVTLSFYARAGANYSAASNALKVRAQYSTSTVDGNAYYGPFAGAVDIVNTSVTLSTTWQRFTLTGTVGATATQIGFWFNEIPTGTAGAADYYEVTGVQLELGSNATAFSRAGGTIQGELAACQRYYYRQGGDNVSQTMGSGIGATSTIVTCNVYLPVQMRVAPTAVDYSTLQVTDVAVANTAVSSLAIATSSNSKNVASINATVASGITTTRPYNIQAANSLSAYLGLSAEL